MPSLLFLLLSVLNFAFCYVLTEKMIHIYIQLEGAVHDIVVRCALLCRLSQLSLQCADHRQRNDGCNHRTNQQ